MCLTVEARLFCNHTAYDVAIVCQAARSGHLGRGPSVAELCPYTEIVRVDSTACCQECLLDLLEGLRDEACLVCWVRVRARCMAWELSNLRRDVEHGRLMEALWRPAR
jgi:hypothetical protein